MKPRLSHLVPALLAAAALAAPACVFGQAYNPAPGLNPQFGNMQRPPQGNGLPCTVTFTLWRGVILVSAIVGDGVPMPTAIDTGLGTSVMTPQLAAKKGVKPSGTREIEVLDHKITVANAPAQNVRMDRLALGGIPFVIGDLMAQFTSKPVPDAPPVWLGASALDGMCVTIDPSKAQLTFKLANSNVSGKVTRVPFVLRDGRIWIDVTANGSEKFEALLDTGALATLLPGKVAAKLQLKPDTTLEMVDRNGKPGKVGVAKLKTLELGKLETKEVPVLFVTEGDPQGVSQDFAVIGNDFLLKHRVTIDFGRKEVAFEPLQPEPAKKEKKNDKKDGKKRKKDASAENKDSKDAAQKDPSKDSKKDDATKQGDKPKDDPSKQGDKPPSGDPPPKVNPDPPI